MMKAVIFKAIILEIFIRINNKKEKESNKLINLITFQKLDTDPVQRLNFMKKIRILAALIIFQK